MPIERRSRRLIEFDTICNTLGEFVVSQIDQDEELAYKFVSDALKLLDAARISLRTRDRRKATSQNVHTALVPAQTMMRSLHKALEDSNEQ